MKLYTLPIMAVLLAGCAASEIPSSISATPYEALEQAVSRAAIESKAGAILDVQGCGLDFRQAAGVANRKTGAPMPLDEPLRIASIGKLYTSAVIHRLAQDGRLDIDASAQSYFEDDEISGVPNSEATVRQLLNHTSGIPDYYDTRYYIFTDWKQPITPQRALKVAKRRKPAHAPGEAYEYSNTNYQILGMIAEKVSGQSLSYLIDTEVLSPLGLAQTRYNTDHPGGTIHGYGTELRRNADTWAYAENTGADSGITATSEDLSKYLSALFLTDGAYATVGAAMLENPVERERPRQLAGPGAEILVSRSGINLAGHTGGTFGYLTFAFAIPEYDLTMIGHINADRSEALGALLQETSKAVQQACAIE